MPRRVKGPDGVIHQFPDDASDQEIGEALEGLQVKSPTTQGAKPTTWSDSLGLNEPTASPVVGFMRGAGAGAVDFAQGVVSNVTGQMNTKLGAENTVRREAGLRPTATLPTVETPQNFSGSAGHLAPTVAEMAIPAGSVAKTAAKAIPSTTRAAENFSEVMGAAGRIPIDITAPGKVALRIQELAERGGSMPMAVRKFLVRVTDPNKAAMNYEEGRDFASNISRLSSNELGRLTPVVAKEVAELRVALNHANAMAAKQAGKGAEYAAAMKEYAQAMRVRNIVNAAIDGAKQTAPYATAAGAGYWLTKKLGALIDQ